MRDLKLPDQGVLDLSVVMNVQGPNFVGDVLET
jgi:hypothetical protein